jgi:hypothetical protein
MPAVFAVDEEVLFHIDKRENNVKDCRFHSLVVCCPFIACRQGQSVPDRNLARFDRSFDLRFQIRSLKIFQTRQLAPRIFHSTSWIRTRPGSATVSITLNFVPQGAVLKVGGKEAGTTPKIVDVAIGTRLNSAKRVFKTEKFPLEITSRDASGGSVSYELGSPAHDTIELRDGSVLSGDLVSISGMQVQVRIGGNTQTFDRHQIKRILLTERDPVAN